ncbi:FlaA1/EpsC-like NDP-sugar epimerase [Fluviicoccus keumensis]|uniref:FlaA1/EpsC-like NDP-sugar epimerase n=1 Tax=Fluviicoccus keumensis TaxID=1435465 RepID=A0A4Q7Z9S3_9GAMM|nr:nucleoside-diphosphate sugar epimerase/dehydratase [Fluviicoccus keumensis]RZU47280.1 FlaA1/EpsC-like NDP-sugar epimerase [Fluviicoccus keumensis]
MLHQLLVGLSRRAKVALMVSVDTVLLVFGLWLALSLRYGYLWAPFTLEQWLCIGVAVGSGVASLVFFGFYRWMVRYVSGHTVSIVFKALAVSALALGTTIMASRAELPRSAPVLYLLVAGFLVVSSRFLAQRYLQRKSGKARIPIVIYGAGNTGSQLALSLQHSNEYRPVAFIDDRPALQGMLVFGIKVHAPSRLSWLIEEYGVAQIFLAMPSLSNSRRKDILLFLEPCSLKVKTVPRLRDIIDGKARPEEVKDIDLEDLLGRDPVPPDMQLMGTTITGKCVLVTGAGGSIGSELCRKILELKPSMLVLLEQSEYGLYAIEQELRGIQRSHPELRDVLLGTVLGSVRDARLLATVFREYAVATVFHAAAYKHVPIVESNVVEGVSNNVFGTLAVARAAQEAGAATFVLISTDKAVRPTNIMGASKRMAELLLQALAQEEQRKPADKRTCFCMVRFGNVLGSSGSVVPLFKEQIREGGPVTVTHPDIIRYFMTIPEAAQLVIQAAAMASGGDVFLLDMGEPVRIADMARRMIHLMGFPVRQPGEEHGIAIEYTGLRPGEKLYEELLVGDADEPTRHERIRRAIEVSLSPDELDDILIRMRLLCEEGRVADIYELFRTLGIGFASSLHLPRCLPISAVTMP